MQSSLNNPNLSAIQTINSLLDFNFIYPLTLGAGGIELVEFLARGAIELKLSIVTTIPKRPKAG